jgi:hypothetical protein
MDRSCRADEYSPVISRTDEVAMSRSARLPVPGALAILCAVLALAVAPGFAAKEAPPEVSPEGLHLVKSTKTRLVYVRPGASLAQYRRVAILECLVQFEKDWQRDYNNSQIGLEGRVSDADVERMKTGLAAEFKKVFADELAKKGGYEVVDVAAPDVLVLRPALINVEVNAPDLMTPGFSRTIVRSAGQMTLFLELWDSTSNTLLARVLDAQEAGTGMAQVANRATNVADADRILRDWARELRERLDDARQATAPK